MSLNMFVFFSNKGHLETHTADLVLNQTPDFKYSNSPSSNQGAIWVRTSAPIVNNIHPSSTESRTSLTFSFQVQLCYVYQDGLQALTFTEKKN